MTPIQHVYMSLNLPIKVGIMSVDVADGSGRLKPSRSRSSARSRDLQDDDVIKLLYGKLINVSISDPSYFEWLDNLKDYTHGVHLPQWIDSSKTIADWVMVWDGSKRKWFEDLMNHLCDAEKLMTIYLSRVDSVYDELTKMSHSDTNRDIDRSNLRNLLSEAALTSGGIEFYGSIGISLLETGTVCNIDHLFHFTTMYMLTDHWLDDATINREQKLKMAVKLYRLVQNPRRVHDSPVISILTDRLVNLVRDRPLSHSILKEAFEAEMISAVVQSKGNLSADMYLKICEWKGGSMIQVIQSLCGSKPDRSGYIAGACIQLMDDMHDIDEDIADGIHTIATHIKNRYGNLDPLLFYTINLVNQLDEKHTLLKPGLMAMMMHSVSLIPYFSSELREKCVRYFPLEDEFGPRRRLYDKMKQHLSRT